MTKKKVRKLKTAQRGSDQPITAKTVKDDVAAPSAASAGQEGVTALSGIAAFKQYLRDVRAEFDKITWPNRKETISMTIAVLAISVFFAAYLGLVDMSLSKLVGTIID